MGLIQRGGEDFEDHSRTFRGFEDFEDFEDFEEFSELDNYQEYEEAENDQNDKFADEDYLEDTSNELIDDSSELNPQAKKKGKG